MATIWGILKQLLNTELADVSTKIPVGPLISAAMTKIKDTYSKDCGRLFVGNCDTGLHTFIIDCGILEAQCTVVFVRVFIGYILSRILLAKEGLNVHGITAELTEKAKLISGWIAAPTTTGTAAPAVPGTGASGTGATVPDPGAGGPD